MRKTTQALTRTVGFSSFDWMLNTWRTCFILDDSRFGDKPGRHGFLPACLRSVVYALSGRFEPNTLSLPPTETFSCRSAGALSG